MAFPPNVPGPTVTHPSLQVCTAHTRVPAQQLELFIYFEGRIHFTLRDRGAARMLPAPAPGQSTLGGRSVSPGGPAGDCARAGATLLPAGPYIKVSDSSPPIGQSSKSAFKFLWCWVFFFFPPRRGGQEELLLYKFFSLYVDAKRKLRTGHVRM